MDIDRISIGLLIGFSAGAALIGTITKVDQDRSILWDTAIEICQAELPRSQKCVITAIPEVGE